MMAKRDDSAYSPLRGHVPKDLYIKFKIYCIEDGMDNSQALENVLRFYFEYRDEVVPKSDTATEFEKIRGKRAKEKSV